MQKKNKGKIEWMEILFWVVIIALFIMILTKMFGSSATEIQIYLGFITSIVVVMSFLAKHHREIGVIETKIENNFEKVKESFVKVREDMNRIENKIDVLINKKSEKKR